MSVGFLFEFRWTELNLLSVVSKHVIGPQVHVSTFIMSSDRTQLGGESLREAPDDYVSRYARMTGAGNSSYVFDRDLPGTSKCRHYHGGREQENDRHSVFSAYFPFHSLVHSLLVWG